MNKAATQIPNEVLEQVFRSRFNGYQMRIIIALWRYTFGSDRVDHDIPVGRLAVVTGIDEREASRVLLGLIESNVITVTKTATPGSPRRIAFNCNFEQWTTEVGACRT